MERVRVFCLLLLLCSLSGAEDITAALAELRVTIEKLQTQNQVGKVAFSASLMGSDSTTLGPYNTDTPLVFGNVFSNIGNAYNPNTGSFTAPVRGAYHFEFYICSWGSEFHSTTVVLVKNADHIVMAHERGINGHSSAANGVTLLLESGDAVFLRLGQGSTIHDNHNHFSTFSGHLLFPM